MRPDVYCYSHELRWRQLWRDAGGNVGQFCDKLKAHRGARPMPSALSVARALVGVSLSPVAVAAATAADVSQSIRRFISSVYRFLTVSRRLLLLMLYTIEHITPSRIQFGRKTGPE